MPKYVVQPPHTLLIEDKHGNPTSYSEGDPVTLPKDERTKVWLEAGLIEEAHK